MSQTTVIKAVLSVVVISSKHYLGKGKKNSVLAMCYDEAVQKKS